MCNCVGVVAGVIGVLLFRQYDHILTAKKVMATPTIRPMINNQGKLEVAALSAWYAGNGAEATAAGDVDPKSGYLAEKVVAFSCFSVSATDDVAEA